MNRIEAKHLSIEFLNRAYELVELAETCPEYCPEESRYLSHGYYLKLEHAELKKYIYLVIFKKNDDGLIEPTRNYSWLFILPNSVGGYHIDYDIIQYALGLYMTWIINDEPDAFISKVHFLHTP